jgi:hypothetical protein
MDRKNAACATLFRLILERNPELKGHPCKGRTPEDTNYRDLWFCADGENHLWRLRLREDSTLIEY